MTAKRISGGSSFTIEDAYQRSPLARWRTLPATARTCIIFALSLIGIIVITIINPGVRTTPESEARGNACFVAQRIQQKSVASYTGEDGMSVQTATGLLFGEARNSDLTESQREGFRTAWGEVVTTGNLGSAGSSALATIASETC